MGWPSGAFSITSVLGERVYLQAAGGRHLYFDLTCAHAPCTVSAKPGLCIALATSRPNAGEACSCGLVCHHVPQATLVKARLPQRLGAWERSHACSCLVTLRRSGNSRERAP